MELLTQLMDVVLHLDQHLQALVASHGAWIYLILFLIVFCETGLVVTPFLPGDSLLFVAGTVAAAGGMDIHLLVLLLIIAAVLAAAEITYLRSLNPFERFDLVTRLMTWDDKYVYMEQTFERDGELCAHAYVKGLFLSGEGRVPNAEVVGIMGYAGAAPVMSEALRRWAALTMTKRDSVK